MMDTNSKREQSATDQFLCTEEFDFVHFEHLNSTFKKGMNPANGYISLTQVNTEVGTVIAGATDKGVCLFEFADSTKVEMELVQLISLFNMPLREGENPHFDILREQIKRYFKGELREFTIPLDLVGTDFQVQAWRSLSHIPYGTTTTYAKQAASLGKPSAVRAIANANGKNRISIILPCHRVIGSDGKLTGYGGGMWRKRKLLELEHALPVLPFEE